MHSIGCHCCVIDDVIQPNYRRRPPWPVLGFCALRMESTETAMTTRPIRCQTSVPAPCRSAHPTPNPCTNHTPPPTPYVVVNHNRMTLPGLFKARFRFRSDGGRSLLGGTRRERPWRCGGVGSEGATAGGVVCSGRRIQKSCC